MQRLPIFQLAAQHLFLPGRCVISVAALLEEKEREVTLLFLYSSTAPRSNSLSYRVGMPSLLFLDRKEDNGVWRMLKLLSCRQVENCFGCNTFAMECSIHPEPACGRSVVRKDLNKCLHEKSLLFNQDVVESLHDP